MLHSALVGLLIAAGLQAPESTLAPKDPLSLIAGAWQVVDDTGKALQSCEKAQHFEVTPDRRSVILTEPWAKFTARYLVVHSEEGRVLMFIEDEKRTTEQGDPILWWANFDGPDRFRWRQYDWGADNATTAEWRRCPLK